MLLQVLLHCPVAAVTMRNGINRGCVANSLHDEFVNVSTGTPFEADLQFIVTCRRRAHCVLLRAPIHPLHP